MRHASVQSLHRITENIGQVRARGPKQRKRERAAQSQLVQVDRRRFAQRGFLEEIVRTYDREADGEMRMQILCEIDPGFLAAKRFELVESAETRV